MISATLRHYRIEAKLGEGGMGIVYRAVDTRLGRSVAIKVLPPEVLADSDRKRRFAQEARAASALNHPNIVTIYEIDSTEFEGRLAHYIAMEHVAGKTLRELVGRKGLELGAALKYAVQIADALAVAHAAGIVHRDIKPANIMVTEQGLVKVLDFGLAKLAEPAGGELCDATLSLEPDRAPRTEEGVVVGTVAYMSPEQAQGKKIDGRSDIFSFGAVLYEMLTGRRAFPGDNKVSTLAAVLQQEPQSIRELVESVPRDLERIIVRCLRKDPEYRFQHMADVKVALRELKEESESGQLEIAQITPAPLGAAPVRGRRAARVWMLTAVLLSVLAFAGWWWAQSRARAPSEGASLVRVTADSGLTTDPAISPDGKLLAYASDRNGEGNLDIWVRQVAGGEPIRLTSDSADDFEPCFSPDSVQVAFRSEREGGGVYVVPALGGEARLLVPHGRNPRYSPDGKWIACWVGERQALSDIYIVPATGGAPRKMEFRPAIPRARHPLWSSDGKDLLFLGQEAQREDERAFDWWVASLETGAASPTGAFDLFQRQGLPYSYDTSPGDWIGDQVFFSAGLTVQRSKRLAQAHDVAVLYDNTNLWQLRIAPGTWRAAGPAVRLTFGTGVETKPSAAAGGLLAFSSLAENINVWSLAVEAGQVRQRGPLQRLTEDVAPASYPSVSPDGRYLVFSSERSGNADIWLKDLQTGRERRLTMDPAFETFPLIATGGSKVAYEAFDQQRRSIFAMALGPEGRPGAAQMVCENCGYLSDLSADGKYVLYYDDPPRAVTLQDADSREKTIVLRHKWFLSDPRFSPDGRWAAFHAIVGPVRRQVFVAPVRLGAPTSEQDWIPITDGMGMDRLPAWSPDGKILYFISERDGYRCISGRRLDLATKKPSGPVFEVYHLHGARRSMMNFVNASLARMSVARDKIVFSLLERTGNIWMTKLESR